MTLEAIQQIERLRAEDDASRARYADLPVYTSPEAVCQAHPGVVCLCGVDLFGHNPDCAAMDAAELTLRHQIDRMGAERAVAVLITKGERPVQAPPAFVAPAISLTAWGYSR